MCLENVVMGEFDQKDILKKLVMLRNTRLLYFSFPGEIWDYTKYFSSNFGILAYTDEVYSRRHTHEITGLFFSRESLQLLSI